jgi:hypothetical protein
MARDRTDVRYPRQAGDCSLSRWSGAADRCRWCDEPAAPGFDWCSNLCEDTYRANHWWDQARAAALARDDHRCTTCGVGPDTIQVARLFIRAFIPMGPVEAAELWHSDQWFELVLASSVEVNHIVPRRGNGYGSGCHHHLDGLETLCHRHHVAVTARQQREAGRRAG